MAFLQTFTRPNLAQQMAQEYASQAALPADTHPGSDLGSIFNAEALLGIILQQQIVYVNSIARLSTIGPNPTNAALPNPDVDSFVNAFGINRLSATYSSGQVVFSVASAPAAPIYIPAVPAGTTGGVIVQTVAGVQFEVIIDTTNANYSSTYQSYVLSAGQTSVSCTVQSLVSGTLGNVAAAQLNQLYSGPGATALAGISSVSNPLAFANAGNQESDAALKVRFAKAMVTGSVATPAAIAAAILASALNLTYSVGDGLSGSGSAAPAFFTVVVNNAGTGTAPSGALLSTVSNAVNLVRAAGISYTVVAPTLVAVNTTANIKIATGYTPAAVIAACNAAYISLINNIGLDPAGASTSAKIAAVYATLYNIPGVSDVTALTLNSGSVDVTATFAQQLYAGTVSFSPV